MTAVIGFVFSPYFWHLVSILPEGWPQPFTVTFETDTLQAPVIHR
jgi:hypothetical protein